MNLPPKSVNNSELQTKDGKEDKNSILEKPLANNHNVANSYSTKPQIWDDASSEEKPDHIPRMQTDYFSSLEELGDVVIEENIVDLQTNSNASLELQTRDNTVESIEPHVGDNASLEEKPADKPRPANCQPRARKPKKQKPAPPYYITIE